MSWNEYVNTTFISTGKISKAMILGGQGGVWGASSGFELSAEEQKAILSVFIKPEAVLSTGLRIAGQKYFAISADDHSIHLKKQADGVLIVKVKNKDAANTTKAIIVAQYVAPIQAGEAVVVVDHVAAAL